MQGVKFLIMATKRKKSGKTKKDLEAKIAELEGKLTQLSSQLAQKPAAQAPPPPPPKASPPPPPPKPAEAPKPAPKAQAAPPATLESLYESVPMGNWNERKAKTPAYVPENPRAWARRHATGADAPTQSWILQKATITGYTAPSNKYFATKQRLAHHPHHPDKNFLGYGISLGHAAGQGQAQSAPPPPPTPQQTQGKLPKGTAASSGGTGKSRQQELEDYEKDYVARMDKREADAEAEVAQAQAQAQQALVKHTVHYQRVSNPNSSFLLINLNILIYKSF